MGRKVMVEEHFQQGRVVSFTDKFVFLLVVLRLYIKLLFFCIANNE